MQIFIQTEVSPIIGTNLILSTLLLLKKFYIHNFKFRFKLVIISIKVVPVIDNLETVKTNINGENLSYLKKSTKIL